MTDSVVSVLPADISATAIAADAIIGLAGPFTFEGLGDGDYLFRCQLDAGLIHIADGTAGQVTIGAGLWFQTAATAAPTSWATHDYLHGNQYMTRHATLDQSFRLGAIMIDETVTITAGDWEVYVGLGVEAVGDLNGVNVTGITPSGFVTINPVT